MDIKQAVMAELDKIVAAGEKRPPLRTLRARVGGGSLSTISEAVRDWENAQIAAPVPLPNDLNDSEQKVICSAVWRALMPMIENRLAAASAAAEAKIDAERKSAAQLREEAEATIAESVAQTEELKKARALIERQRKEIEQCKEQITWLEKRNNASDATIADALKERDAARREAAALKAEVDTLNRLLPLIDARQGKSNKASHDM